MSGSLPADHFVDRLLAAGFDFFVGVPCSLVKTLLVELERRGLYLGETREDAALGMAAGAYLAGRTPVVVMQNSAWGCRSTRSARSTCCTAFPPCCSSPGGAT